MSLPGSATDELSRSRRPRPVADCIPGGDWPSPLAVGSHACGRCSCRRSPHGRFPVQLRLSGTEVFGKLRAWSGGRLHSTRRASIARGRRLVFSRSILSSSMTTAAADPDRRRDLNSAGISTRVGCRPRQLDYPGMPVFQHGQPHSRAATMVCNRHGEVSRRADRHSIECSDDIALLQPGFGSWRVGFDLLDEHAFRATVNCRRRAHLETAPRVDHPGRGGSGHVVAGSPHDRRTYWRRRWDRPRVAGNIKNDEDCEDE